MGRPEQQRARLAWTILLAAFGLFVFACAVVPQTAAALVQGAARPENATLSIQRGSVRLERPGSAPESLSVEDQSNASVAVRPGSTLRTGENSEARLQLFNGSVVELRPNTRLELLTSRQRLFANGRDEIRLRLERGGIRINVQSADSGSFTLATPFGDVALDPGEYLVPLSDDGGYARVIRGRATARGEGATVRASQDERIGLTRGRAPQGPLPLEIDLVRNGSFDQGADGLANWDRGNRDIEGDLEGGDVQAVTDAGDRVLRFRRLLGTTYHAETYVLQKFPAEMRFVRDFEDIRIRIEFRLEEQSLPGGGAAGSEYPLELRLKWFNQSGEEVVWRYGFYAVPPREGFTRVRQGQSEKVGWEWQTVTLLLTDPRLGISRPDTLVDLQLVASGWDYESLVRRVEILAK